MEQHERTLRRRLRRAYPRLAESRPQVDAEQSGGDLLPKAVKLVRAELKPSLFRYQADLVGQVAALFEGGNSALLSLPTGGGKTRTAVIAVLESLGSFPRAAWLAPTIELVDQAIRTFESMWRLMPSARDFTLTRGVPSSADSPVVWLTTPQAITALREGQVPLGRWDVVVFDEAHQIEAPTFKAAAVALQRSSRGTNEPSAPLLGLSATPGRTDSDEASSLIEWFSGRLLTSDALGENPVQSLQRDGVLAQLDFRRLTKNVIDPQDEATRLVIAARACEELTRRHRKVLVFTGSVAGAYALAEILEGQGVSSAAVDGQLSNQVRDRRLQAFANGDIEVVANMRLLATGYDCPAISDCLLLSPVRSPILFEQMVGRAARGPRTGGWSKSTIWDFDDHLNMHGLPSSYYRFPDWNSTGRRVEPGVQRSLRSIAGAG